LVFLAQDAEQRFFCYANTDLRKEEQHDEILAFGTGAKDVRVFSALAGTTRCVLVSFVRAQI
jgi:hypothetical protein